MFEVTYFKGEPTLKNLIPSISISRSVLQRISEILCNTDHKLMFHPNFIIYLSCRDSEGGKHPGDDNAQKIPITTAMLFVKEITKPLLEHGQACKYGRSHFNDRKLGTRKQSLQGSLSKLAYKFQGCAKCSQH